MRNFIRKALGFITAAAVAVCSAVFPSFADDTPALPENEAMLFVDAMGAGWNLGNTFDASNCTWCSNELDYETGWQKVKTTKELISAIREMGFKTIRVPVSWHNHMDENFNINEPWMARVQEVIDWCVEEDLYIIINAHHDIQKGYYYPDNDHYAQSEQFITSVWKQISERFKNYSNKLIFEIINEPRLAGSGYEWWYDLNNPPDLAKESLDCINRLNQKALDTIRATGGNNSDRFVLVGGYDTDGSEKGILSPMYVMPKDSAKDRLIADIHYYNIAKIASKQAVDKIYNNLTSKGIPVILSEYGIASDPGYDYTHGNGDTGPGVIGEFTAYARQRGITVVIWDNNGDLNAENKSYRIVDRAKPGALYPKVVDALVKNGAPILTTVETPEASAEYAGGKITFTWERSEGAESYSVLQLKDKKYVAIKENITGTSVTIKGFKSGSDYKFVVVAKANGKQSKYTNDDVITVNAYTKPVVTSSVSKGKIKLKWHSVNGAEKYAVYKYTNGKAKLITDTLAKTSITLKGYKSGKTYEFYVTAYVNGKWTKPSRSDIISVTI